MIREGEPAPALTGVTSAGDTFDLAALRPRCVAIEFFRGTWCPNCRRRLLALREALPRFEAAHASLVGVVCQKRANVAAHFARAPLPFPLVVDEDRQLARRWGVYRPLGIDAIHIARPATFVVDGGGIVRLAALASSQFTRVDLERILECLVRSAA